MLLLLFLALSIYFGFIYSVATIGGHVLYKIEDTMIYPIMQQGSKPSHPDESKYITNYVIKGCNHRAGDFYS